MRRLLCFAIAGILSGCVVGPDYQRPTVETPKQWSKPSATTLQTKALEKYRYEYGRLKKK